MSHSFNYLDDIVIADMAFEAFGDTPKELFEAAAQALFRGMADIGRVQPKIRREIHLRNAEIDQLLFDWLSELIYLKDAKQLLFSEFTVALHNPAEAPSRSKTESLPQPKGESGEEKQVVLELPERTEKQKDESDKSNDQKAGSDGNNSNSRAPAAPVWSLSGVVRGESINPRRHHLRSDVKAVTYHQFEVGRLESGGWKARVVLDI